MYELYVKYRYDWVTPSFIMQMLLRSVYTTHTGVGTSISIGDCMVFKELLYDMNWQKEEWRGEKILMSKKGYGLFCIPHMSIMWVLWCISVCISWHESTLYPPSPVALFSPFCTSASWTISVEERIIPYVLQRQQVALLYTQCRNHESLQIWPLISQKMNPVTT